MNQIIAQWEDEENNRQVQFSVDYVAENGAVAIQNVTPAKVSFICPESNTCSRTIGVHTDKGREMLTAQIKKAGQLDRLADELAEKHGALVTA